MNAYLKHIAAFAFLLLMALFAGRLYAKSPDLIPFDAVLNIIKERSVHRQKIPWSTVESEIKQQLASATNNEAVLKIFVQLFQRMNDVHSSLIYKNRYFGYYETVSPETAKPIMLLSQLAAKESGQIKSKLLKTSIGYIQIPAIQAFGTENINYFAQQIQDQICLLAKSSPRAWIVDLRLNRGGNMLPMLAGLSGLLGNGVVGVSIDASGVEIRQWELKQGDLYFGEHRATSIGNRCLIDFSTAPVAVLISRITMSSGEATAIAFKSRPNTYFIGEPTAKGYTTGTDWIPINQDLTLNLSTDFMADRHKTVYKTHVVPDQEIYNGDSFEDLNNDTKIRAAIVWLMHSNAAH